MSPLINLLSISSADITMALSSPTMQKALAVGTIVSLCAAMLGVILVLKRYALIGHGLGEVSFAATSIAALIGMGDYPLLVAIPLVCLSSILIMRLDRHSRMGGDVLIGIFSTGALAAGVIASVYTDGYKGVYNGLFSGSIFGLKPSDVWLSVVLGVVVILAFVLLYNKLFSVTYDETFARATGVNADWYQFIISLLTSLSVVLGMRVMGAMMISSFIIFPAITSRRLACSFKGMIICSMIIALFSFILGMSISYFTEAVNLPTGACVVAVSLLIMLVVYAVTGITRRNGGRRQA